MNVTIDPSNLSREGLRNQPYDGSRQRASVVLPLCAVLGPRSALPTRGARALGPQRDIVIALPDAHGHMLVTVGRHEHRWTPVHSVGAAASGTENDVTPFVAEGGQVVIAWYDTQLCEGGCQYPGYVRTAVLPAGRSKFTPEQILEKDEIGLQGAPIVASLAPSVIQIPGRAPIIVFLARTNNTSQTTGLTPTLVKVKSQDVV